MPAALHRTTIALTLALVVLLPGPVAGASAPAASEASSFEAAINRARQAAGLGGYAGTADLRAVAQRHAQRMADQGRYFHNPNLRNEVSGWAGLGENVGVGPTVGDLHRALMASPSHRANILSRDWTQVGVGTARTPDGRLWVVLVFRLPARAASPAPPAPPAPTAPPAPVARALPPPPPPAPTTTTTAPPPPAPTTTSTVAPPPEPTPATIGAASVGSAEPASVTAPTAVVANGSLSRPATVAALLILLVGGALLAVPRRLLVPPSR